NTFMKISVLARRYVSQKFLTNNNLKMYYEFCLFLLKPIIWHNIRKPGYPVTSSQTAASRPSLIQHV
ncbi:MALRD1 isoform 3, partial [Pongo abelii]